MQQLTFEGLSVTAIARRTGTKQKEVKAALAVPRTQAAASATQGAPADSGSGGGADRVRRRGRDQGGPDQGRHHRPGTFRARGPAGTRRKVRAKTTADAEAELAARGYTILDTDPGYYDTEYTRISELLTADDQRVTVENIENLDGRAAHVRVYADGDANVSYFIRDAKAAGLSKTRNAAS